MKRVLLGSTALLGAAMIFAAPAAAEMEISFGGFLKAEFWGASQDVETDRPRGYNFGVDDSEFYIRAKNTADNGLSYGVNIDVEIKDNVATDEAFLWFSGDNWGTLQLGGNDNVMGTMPYSGDFSLTATGGYDGGMGAVWNFQNDIYFPSAAGTLDDEARINYYSPRFSGFQIGLSYAVDSGQAGVGSDSEDSDGGDDEDAIAIGVNFVDTINGIDIGIGGAYYTASLEDGAAASLEDTQGLHIGFNVGMSGFTFGASYGDNFDSGCSVAGCDGGSFYEVAGGYGTGPWTVGIGWFHGEKDITTTTDEETDIISITGKYTLAPGAVIYSELNFIDESSSENDNNDGTTYMIGTAISF